MATSAGIGTGNGSVNVTMTAQEAAAAARHERFHSQVERAVGLKFDSFEEFDLYWKWLSLPHPEIHLGTYLDTGVRELDSPLPELEAEAAASITERQVARFSRIAETIDIRFKYYKLQEFREGMEKIREVLEAQLEDEMAGFDAEDFKKMEGEDDRARDKAKVRQEESSRAKSCSEFSEGNQS